MTVKENMAAVRSRFISSILSTITKRSIAMCLLIVTVVGLLSSCEDNVSNSDQEDLTEFTTQWKERNIAFFDSIMTVACNEVANAKATYGNEWEEHCQWRVFLSFAKVGGRRTDSICARVISTTGQGSSDAHPLYTDSVKINYMGHLIPTKSYAEGRVFDHSGIYESESYVFSPNYSVPSSFAVSNVVEGLTTALMHMHVGDRWMVYMPQELGYMSTAAGAIPSYSTLCFDTQLKGFYRKGEKTN